MSGAKVLRLCCGPGSLSILHCATLGVLEAQREAGSGGLWPAMGLYTRLLRSLPVFTAAFCAI